MSRRILAILSALVVMSILSACAAPPAAPAAEQPAAETTAAETATAEAAATEAGAEAAPGAAPEQVLIGGFDVGPGGDPQVIPYFQGAGNTWLSKIYTPLVMMAPDFSQTTVDGSLSESWESSEDQTSWTFHLRPVVA